MFFIAGYFPGLDQSSRIPSVENGSCSSMTTVFSAARTDLEYEQQGESLTICPDQCYLFEQFC